MRITIGIFSLRWHSGLSNDCIALADALHARGHKVLMVCGDIRRRIDRDYAILNLGISARSNAEFNLRSYRGILSAHQRKMGEVLVGFNKMPNLDFYYMGDFCWAERTANKPRWQVQCSRRHRQQLHFESAVFHGENRTIVLSQSERARRQYQHHYGTANQRFFALPARANERNILDLDESERNRIRQSHNTHYHDIIWLSVGSGFKTKGIDRSVKALANPRLSHCQLWVVGADAPKRLQRMARKLSVSDRVHFLGQRNDVGKLMRSADLLLHPARGELSGTVIMEAIANHLPVICSNNCGNADYVRHSGAGIVTSTPFDQFDFENALAMLGLHHRKREDAAAKAARYYAENARLWSGFILKMVEHIEETSPVSKAQIVPAPSSA